MGSRRAKNLSLLEKWKWRWLTEADSHWTRIVASVNGGEPGTLRFRRRGDRWSVWMDICKVSSEVESLGLDSQTYIGNRWVRVKIPGSGKTSGSRGAAQE